MRKPLRCEVVGVIASRADLGAAKNLREPPDYFELRLDRLPGLQTSDLAALKTPLLLTARHPAEGGRLPAATRRELFERFLPHARALDLELRSLKTFSAQWREARRRKLLRICSLHAFNGTPTPAFLNRKFEEACAGEADIFKIVARADSAADFVRLRDFLFAHRGKVAVLATGRYGPRSRREFPLLGSRLIYAPLLRPFHSGQLTLSQLRAEFV